MMASNTIPRTGAPPQAPSWPALQRELEQFLNTQRRSFAREAARMALWSQTPQDAWKRLDDIAARQMKTPAWLYELQERIRPREVRG